MSVVVMALNNFTVLHYTGVTSISFDKDAKTYTVNEGSTPHTFNAETHKVSILF